MFFVQCFYDQIKSEHSHAMAQVTIHKFMTRNMTKNHSFNTQQLFYNISMII